MSLVVPDMEWPQRKREAQDRRLSIIDVSSADDSLIDPLSGNAFDHQQPENQECMTLFETPNSKKFENAASKVEQWEEEASQPNETFEAEKINKNSKCNLRKSLAWDSAFFTSAGVLDPEELSSIIEGIEKEEEHALPVIQEDLYKSFDSISTTESDNLTLGSIESDLFEDTRASIQKSSNKSNMMKVKSKVLSTVARSHIGNSSKKIGMAPQNKAKPASQNPRSGMQGSGKMTKKYDVSSQVSQLVARGEPSILKQPKILGKSSPSSTISAKRASHGGLHVKIEEDKEKQVIGALKKIGMAPQNEAKPASQNPSSSMQGSGKMTKKNHVSSQVSQKLVATRGEPSILKQPKILGKSSPSSTISAKRALLGGLHVKIEKAKEKQVIGGGLSTVSKAPIQHSSRGILPKPILSSKSSTGPSVATKTKCATSTSSGSHSSDNISKSPSHFLKRKVGAGIIKSPSAGSAVKTPSKVSRNKTKSGNSSLTASLMSATKLSASISPANSISDWSSESSSSNCMSKQKSNSSRTSLDSISGRKVLSDTDTLQALKSQDPASHPNLEGHQTPGTGFVSKYERTTTTGTVLHHAPTKPSGLRLPSPKIGFFDGVKSLVRTPRGETQSRSAVPNGLPKYKAGNVRPSEGLNKTKLGKLQLAGTSMLTEIPSNQQTSHPITLSGSSHAGNDTSNASQNVKNSSEISMGDQSKTLLPTGAGNSETNNITMEGFLVGVNDPSLDSSTLDISMDETNSEIKGRKYSMDIRPTSTNEEHNNSDSSLHHIENKSSLEIVGEGSVSGQFDLLKAEDAAITRHDTDMLIPDIWSTDNSEVLDSSMDKVSPKGDNAMQSTNDRAIPTDGDCNTHVSSVDYNVENTSHFHIVGTASVECQLDHLNYLHSIECADDQKASHYDSVVDCLSREVDSIDIKTEIQKGTDGDSLSLSHSATGFLANYNALDLPSPRELPCVKRQESLDSSFTPGLSLSPTSFNMPAYGRIPFAVKDSFCNMDSLSGVFTESTVAEVKTTNLPLPESIMKENN